MRLFVALAVPGGVRARLEQAQRDLAERTGSSVRWVRPEGVHLTLKFLGEVEESRAAEIQRALEGVRARRIALAAKGIGFFPDRKRPRTIWAGIEEPTGHLQELQGRVEALLAPLGFPPEDRPFHPHLTLGRSRSPRGAPRVAEAAEALAQEEFGSFTADALYLIQSTLRPQGAIYTTLRAYALAETEGS